MPRIFIAAAFGTALIGSLAALSATGTAAPIVVPAQITGATSPIVEIDRRCGHDRHYVARHRVHDRDGRTHWVSGQCVRDHDRDYNRDRDRDQYQDRDHR